MNRYGTTSEQLGAIAVGQRAWAAKNPIARFREPITLADHQASRMVARPLHLLDCCMVSNGGIAMVLTTVDRAADLPQPPVHVWGWAQTHPGYRLERGSEWGLVSGAAIAGPRAMRMAGVTPADVDVREIYDCYTYTALITLEDYGFCAKGEGGELAASGALGPGRVDADEHRRRSAVELLPVGHDAVVGGGHPGARPGRRTPGRAPRRRPSSAATAACSTSTPRSSSGADRDEPVDRTRRALRAVLRRRRPGPAGRAPLPGVRPAVPAVPARVPRR